MKTVAITPRVYLDANTNETRVALDVKWFELIQAAGFLPIVMPYIENIDYFFKNIKIDGIIFSGGNDLSCVCNANENIFRDKYELRFLEYAIKNNIPILGVCRGMQFIAKYFGCSLVEVDNHIRIKHTLDISENRFNLMPQLPKNSYHKYAVEDAKDMQIIATAGGFIEAICHNSLDIIGIMWHPEREEPFMQEDIEFIQKYFNA